MNTLRVRHGTGGPVTARSDVLAWPESHGFGPAWGGFSPEKCQARPTSHGFGLAWPSFGPGLGLSTEKNTTQVVFVTGAKVFPSWHRARNCLVHHLRNNPSPRSHLLNSSKQIGANVYFWVATSGLQSVQ
jgi:hypothetical protein